MIRAMMWMQKVVFDMCWSFLIAPDGDPGFITSDNPVSLFGPPGVAAQGAYFTFPVSRDLCLFAKHRPGTPQAILRMNAAKVREVNKGTISRADTQLYAPFESPKVQELLNSVVSARGKPKRVMIKYGQVVEEGL